MFTSQIVNLVISKELAVPNEREKSNTGRRITDLMSKPRLGLMRLSALELVDKLQLSYGLRMREVFREADLFSSLLQMYALYPYNDMGLRHVTSIISYSMDPEMACKLN